VRERTSDPVDAAIRRVLDAERDGLRAVAAAREAADRRIAAARADVVEIGKRADRRIACARSVVDTRIARREQEVEEAIRQLRAARPLDAAGGSLIAGAVRRVATTLTRREAP
jgi:vacuolar-type H+-ATPase subunit H